MAADGSGRGGRERGQALLLVVALLAAVLVGGTLIGAFLVGMGERDRAASAADLGALAGGKVMHDLYGRLFEPARLETGALNPRLWRRATTWRRAGRPRR